MGGCVAPVGAPREGAALSSAPQPSMQRVDVPAAPKYGNESARPGNQRGTVLVVAAPRSPRSLVAAIVSEVRRGQGVRVGVVGRTGSGKSYALRALTTALLPALDLALVRSDEPSEWKNAQVRTDLRDCRDRPLVGQSAGGSRLIVLAGDPFQRRGESPDAIAAEAWRRAAPPWRFRAAVIVDELRDAADNGRWRVPDGDLPRALSQGRKVGLSVCWGTQSPQEVPREALGQSDLWLFQLSGREVEHLYRLRVIDADARAALPLLPLRSFISVSGGAWDRAVYRF